MNARALLTFHHILSEKKKAVIKKEARELGIIGICKIGYPGILAIEGKDDRVAKYVREIKSLRWASCTLADNSSGLAGSELKMHNVASAPVSGVLVVEKMAEVGSFMRQAGLEEWWRKAMGYARGG